MVVKGWRSFEFCAAFGGCVDYESSGRLQSGSCEDVFLFFSMAAEVRCCWIEKFSTTFRIVPFE